MRRPSVRADSEPPFDPASYYAAHPLELPPGAERHAWYVREAATGHLATVTGSSTQDLRGRILELGPLEISYDVHDPEDPDRYHVTAFFLHSPLRLALTVRILLIEFGLREDHVEVSRVGLRHHQVVIRSPLFRDAPKARVRRLAAYFCPQGFLPATGRTRTGPQSRYEAALEATLAAWRRMEPTQLVDHLRSKTSLGDHVQRVQDFLHDPTPARPRLRHYPQLAERLHAVGLEAAFPAANVHELLGSGRVLLPGSWDADRRRPIEPLPLARVLEAAA